MSNSKLLDQLTKELEKKVSNISNVQKTVAQNKPISLDDVRLVRIIADICYSSKYHKKVVIAATRIRGPINSLAKTKELIKQKKIDFKHRKDKRADYDLLFDTKEEAVEFLLDLRENEYQYSQDKMPYHKNPERGDYKKVDVYKKLYRVKDFEDYVYIKFCIDEIGVLVISFHWDD